MREIASQIRQHIEFRRSQIGLSFEEDDHKYTVLDSTGYPIHPPSVSKKVKEFYIGFDSQAKSLEMANGDVFKQLKLLKEWKDKAVKGAYIGSRCHYYLEQNLVTYFGLDKELRKPHYEVKGPDITKSDNMIVAGTEYIELMKSRGCMLIDTEVVMGCPQLVGQLDKVWLVVAKNGVVGWFITDWKSTKPESFEQKRWTKYMLPPFQNYIDTATYTYSVQLALYARLFKMMLVGSPFYDMPFLGAIIVILKPDTTYQEIRVPNEIFTLTNNLTL